MSKPPYFPNDPVGWSGLIALVFLALCIERLGIPSQPYFDEVHYLPAARVLLELSHVTNQEHPLLGKEIIALGITLFGDNAVGWRIFAALAGGITLFAFMRLMWFASEKRFATLAGGVLLATAFPLFVQSRIAMLDIFMVCFTMIGLWQCAAALREPETGRWRLAVAGVSLGLAMASKWNALPVAMVPGILFLLYRMKSARLAFVTANRGEPIPGMTLVEASVWLGLVPLLTYALTYLPAFFYARDPLTIGSFVAYHREMLDLQEGLKTPHTYQSTWDQWVLDARAIWYLYESRDGALRGVLLVGNPLIMLAGLPASLWCLWQGVLRGYRAALGMVLLYAVSLGLWIVAAKPVQFYYHYFLPSCFLVAALALTLDAAWDAGKRKTVLAFMAAALALFAYFYPVLSAMALKDPQDFLYWAWIPGWR